MTHEEAIVVRRLQLQGKPIDPALLQEAVGVIRTVPAPAAPRTSKREQVKAGIEFERMTRGDRANAFLLARLQQAMPDWEPAAKEPIKTQRLGAGVVVDKSGPVRLAAFEVFDFHGDA